MLSRSSSLLLPPPTSARHFAVSQGRWISTSWLPGTEGWPPAALCLPASRRISPVPGTTFRPFRASCAGRFLATRSKFPGVVRGLRPLGKGSTPPRPPHGRTGVTTLQASRDVTDWSVAPPRFAPGLSTTHGGFTTGTPASPRTGLAPAGCPQLIAWLRHHNSNLLVVMAPKLLDAPPDRRIRPPMQMWVGPVSRVEPRSVTRTRDLISGRVAASFVPRS
jgi:hypothetical protein